MSRLDDLEALERAATRGWSDECLAPLLRFGRTRVGTKDDSDDDGGSPRARDAAFIAAARNALPALLAVARAAAEVDAAILAMAEVAPDDDFGMEQAFDRRHVAELALRAALAALEATP